MKGYVYVMMNPSYQGVVKIEKTTKDPEERARELSSSTGVATPFVVVYKREFYDCDLAEELAHAVLTEKGYRMNDAREFFSISIPDAIDLILNLPNEMSYMEDFSDVEEEENRNDLAETYYKKGLEFEFGTENTFVNYDKAIECYQLAAEYGFSPGYYRIGYIYQFNKSNIYQAILAYQKSGECGDYRAFSSLGSIYHCDERFKNERNEYIAWNKFFSIIDSFDINSCDDFTLNEIYRECYLYLVCFHEMPKQKEWKIVLSKYKLGLLDYAIDMHDKAKETYDSLSEYDADKETFCYIIKSRLELVDMIYEL